MVDRFKITYLDDCPYSYSAGLFKNIKNILQGNSDPIEIALWNKDENELRLLSQYLYNATKKLNAKKLADVVITTYVDEDEALTNANFVIQSISRENHHTKIYDYYLPLKFGILQREGSMIGPRGIFKSFRTNFRTVATAEKIKKICPKSPFMILTNPTTTNVLAAIKQVPDVTAFSASGDLEIGKIPIQKEIQKLFDFEKNEDFEYYYEYAGIPQCSWFTKIKYAGKDYTDALQTAAKEYKTKKNDKYGLNFYLFEKLKTFCYGSPNQLCTYLPQYYNYFNHGIPTPTWKFDPVALKSDGKIGSFIKNVAHKALPHPVFYRKNNITSYPPVLDIALSYLQNEPKHYPGVVLNQNDDVAIVANLPEDSIVELPMYFKNNTLSPVSNISLEDGIIEIISPYSKSQSFTVDAALGNDLDLTVQAMLQDPLNQWIDDDDKITYLTHLMLYYEQEWLPEEWKEWIPIKNSLKESKWWISPLDLDITTRQYQKFKYPVKEELREKSFFWVTKPPVADTIHEDE